MSNLFSIDGPIFKMSVWISQMMILTFLWLVFNLPLVTIGPSTIAMCSVASKLVRDGETKIFKPFWYAFKSNFKQGLIFSVLTYIIGLNLMIALQQILFSGTPHWGMIILTLIYLFELSLLLLYSYPLLARYEMGSFAILKTALLMGNFHLFSSLTAVALILLGVFIYFQSPIFFMMIVPGIFIWIWTVMVKLIFNRYELQQHINSETDLIQMVNVE